MNGVLQILFDSCFISTLDNLHASLSVFSSEMVIERNNVHVASSKEELLDIFTIFLLKTFESIQNASITVGLSGGSMPLQFAEVIRRLPRELVQKLILVFCDERVVPFSDPESTYGQYKKLLIDTAIVRPDQFICINAEAPDSMYFFFKMK